MKSLLLLLFIVLPIEIFAQDFYSINASKPPEIVKSGHLKMGNSGPDNKKILVTNKYLSLAGKPILPVMGEMHYTRIPKSQWEDVILKMKAGGINIISFYVLWNHHEEIEGQYNWTGNKDLRAFVKLCAKHDMWAYPRLGPWCHGEVRNGGTPDWILQKTNLKDRSNDPVYQNYVDQWFRQIALQLKGLIYRDGGPVMGVQLENEFRMGKSGEDHILWLKKTAVKYGIDVPMYTVTGWQNGSVPPYEVIPLWGGYPDAPWANHLNKNTDCTDYLFTPFRDNETIGNELKKKIEPYIDYKAYPYFTCEVGVGIQNTDHRRLKIESLDGLGIIMSKIASGSNLPGYYMFAGGSNPHGTLTSLEENKDETGYWNAYPIVSYDFQAAIKESGELNESYFEVKKLHYFLNEFGNDLAPMEAYFPSKKEDLQYSVRTKDDAAFFFGMNYCRNNVSSEVKNVQFSVKLKNETIIFPSTPLTIKDKSTFIWPINLKLDDVILKYATAQPLCRIKNNWIFVQDLDSAPEFAFVASQIEKIEYTNGKMSNSQGLYIISGIKPGLNCIITVYQKNGLQQKIVVISKEEGKQAWLLKNGDEKNFFVSDANLYMNGTILKIFTKNEKAKISILETDSNKKEMFTDYGYDFKKQDLGVSLKEFKPLDEVQWLNTAGKKATGTPNELMHRFFQKEFNIGNPSKIKKATLIIASESICRLQFNNVWVNQPVQKNEMNIIDATGYLTKGENMLLLDFPLEEKSKAFGARLVIEFANADKITFDTDQSWITKDSYTYPSSLTKDKGYKVPELLSEVKELNKTIKDFASYQFELPPNVNEISNVFLQINYNGDKAKLYYNHNLIADDFNNGNTWQIGLNRIEGNLENQQLQLEISAITDSHRNYFDNENTKRNATNATVNSIALIPEYTINLDLKDKTFKNTVYN